MMFGNNHLQRNNAEIPLLKSKYLMISGVTDADRVVLKTVTAFFEQENVKEEPRKWRRIEPDLISHDRKEFRYDLKGYYPVDRMRIVFPEKNTLIRVAVASRKEMDKGWTERFNGLFYTLDVMGVSLTENDTVFPMSPDNRYMISLEDQESGFGEGNPVIELGYLPHTLLFMAQGSGPYTLAYGNGSILSINNTDNRLETLLSGMSEDMEKNMIGNAVMVAGKDLGGSKRLKKAKETPSMKKAVLWIILVSAVILCGYMAVSLYRQMEGKK
jgi:hypothetical protein